MKQHSETQLTFAVEAILFACGEPVSIERLAFLLEEDKGEVEKALKRLEQHYNDSERGVRLLFMQDSAQLCSAPEYADVVGRALEKRRISQLSPSALEVLAIIAYFQPATRAYVEKVRGVDSTYTVNTLLSRGLIESCGQLQVPGRPTLYQTSKAFLRVFGLSEISQLPTLPDAKEDSEAYGNLQKAIEAIAQEQEEQKRKAQEEQANSGTLFAVDAEEPSEDEMENNAETPGEGPVTAPEETAVDKPSDQGEGA